MMTSNQPLATLFIADSTFHCYISTSRSLPTITSYRTQLKSLHPNAAHIPYAVSIQDHGQESEDETFDDGEPEAAAVGKELLRVLNLYKRGLRREKTLKVCGGGNCNKEDRFSGLVCESSFDEEFEVKQTDSEDKENGSPVATAVIVVRYFGERLLGVTCGRLTSVYGRVARLALHRHLNGMNVPYIEKYAFGSNHWRSVYGLGAGDAELILDVIPIIEYEDGVKYVENNNTFVEKLLTELKFEGFVGSRAEVLPRLQNLQADLPVVDGSTVVPIYRYPGNYSGTEWTTYPWSPTTLYIKRCVEIALQPLWRQHMNHTVVNYYRHGEDKIDHHSDKDLDLNREGVIVSVSLGCMRLLELKDRTYPHDTSLIELPPGSMFVLGPITNSQFTHSILPVLDTNNNKHERKIVDYYEGSGSYSEQIQSIIDGGGRISVTLRDVRSFLDVGSQRLFGQGLAASFETPILVEDGIITNDSLSKAVKRVRDEDAKERRSSMYVAATIGFIVGCASYHKSSGGTSHENKHSTTLVISSAKTVISATASYWYLRYLKNEARRRREESDARKFFSRMSASGNKY